MAELQRFHRKTILWVVVVSFFSTLTFLAAGERLRMTGDYIYEGRKIYTFNDQKELGKSGSGGCSHEWWHRFNPKKENEQLRAHAHMKMRSTESGDGRHSDVKRELSGVFHAISSANGRFKTGQLESVVTFQIKLMLWDHSFRQSGLGYRLLNWQTFYSDFEADR